MINLTQLKLYRNFSPLKIANISNNGQLTGSYQILKNQNIIGTFKFFDNGQIESLEINEKYRRTKTSAEALLSIFDFCKKKGKEKGLDYLFCYGEDNNPNNVVKLYGKVGYAFDELIKKRFVIPITQKGREYVKRIQNINSGNYIEDFVSQAKMIIGISN